MIGYLLHLLLLFLLTSFPSNGLGLQTVGAASEKRDSNIVTCPLCSTDQSGASSCVSFPDSDETICPTGVGTRNFFENGFRALIASGELEKRDRKNWDFKTTTGEDIPLDTATYPNCGEAVKNSKCSGISRYFGYDATQPEPPCMPDIYMNTGNEVLFGSDNYVTEHVFEGQTLLQFVNWLFDQGTYGPAPPGYTMPSQQWVENFLLGYSKGYSPQGGKYYSFQSPRLGPASTNPPQDYFWNYMARGLGDGVNQRDLVLASTKLNSMKSVLFRKDSPTVDKGGQNETMAWVKTVISVFEYLKWGPVQNTEAMWNKFLRPSNWVDLVCNEFDTQYAAYRGNRPIAGEPTYKDPSTNVVRQGNMRWLWKAFIDDTLATVEAIAFLYCENVRKLFLADSNNPNPKYP
ncbi:hypothetical protein F5Y09DRAFT_311592 [Xylaria sp. FL1042]|nr:hypothetical protein F5Y09DRAFT_311592 [Xylaria sp. FL1042]